MLTMTFLINLKNLVLIFVHYMAKQLLEIANLLFYTFCKMYSTLTSYTDHNNKPIITVHAVELIKPLMH